MKIGIFLNIIDPKEGGASSLLTTIRNSVVSHYGNNEYVILYNGGFWGPYKVHTDGVTYINVNAGKRKAYPFMLWKTIVHLGKNVLRCFTFDGYIPFLYGYLDRIAQNEQIDLIWFTQPVRMKTSVPYVYTLWDLGHHVLPMLPEVKKDWYSREIMYQEMLSRASWIVTGNEQGKTEILNSYSVTPDKIRIVPFPISSFCDGSSKEPDFDVPEKFFIYPAQYWAHKNHIVILKALKILREKYNISPTVYFTGSDKGNKEYIEKTCAELELKEQVVFSGFLSYEELKYMYTQATAMVYASLMGPNNLPPIEAAYLGCPVIISDMPGHREQMKDCALFFEGTNEYALAEQMHAIYVNQNGICDSLKEKMHRTDFSCDYLQEIFAIFNEFEKILRTWKKTN